MAVLRLQQWFRLGQEADSQTVLSFLEDTSPRTLETGSFSVGNEIFTFIHSGWTGTGFNSFVGLFLSGFISRLDFFCGVVFVKWKKMRINQFLARSGVGARRKVEEIILAGRVKVNGKTLTDLSYRVDLEKDQVLVDGKTVRIDEEGDLPKIIAFNKPVGFLSSHEDKFHEKAIFDLLPKEFHKYNYAGRLDLDSRGLLILSSDGDFIQRVTHPSNKIEKEYIVTLQKKWIGNELPKN